MQLTTSLSQSFLSLKKEHLFFFYSRTQALGRWGFPAALLTHYKLEKHWSRPPQTNAHKQNLSLELRGSEIIEIWPIWKAWESVSLDRVVPSGFSACGHRRAGSLQQCQNRGVSARDAPVFEEAEADALAAHHRQDWQMQSYSQRNKSEK